MKFADFFSRALSAVTSAQFPWVKMFKEPTVVKIANVTFRNFYENYAFTFASEILFFVHG
ncbi:hypothetical protein RchiOBHm_Chr5g0017851 [Rosa chinensis]|uniref:Uncharacterized protein n=1 Tax=Rosa chinensis TaxID=74649 RepID=A0A2P6Q6L2_ROSCH|nr:hypothetical protein RchiOBHm_Chr5g0017851 [Rosa chinensis]